jgi:putative phosphoesterase
VADTHLPRFGRSLPASLVEGFREVDLILHAGDLTQAFVLDLLGELAPVHAVAGNNDGPDLAERLGRRRVVEVEGIRIGLTHGDRGRGRTTPLRALSTFEAESVDAVVFGHSHIPIVERHGTRWLVNPGSPTDRRRQPAFSYGLLDVAGTELTPTIVRFSSRDAARLLDREGHVHAGHVMALDIADRNVAAGLE